MNISYSNGNVILENAENFDIAQTLDCGQAFRWKNTQGNIWEGIAYDTYLKIEQHGNNVILYNTDKTTFENIWYNYFDLQRDYSAIIRNISSNEKLKEISASGSGIRILKQDSWEAICSFIISQNNNIPRIKGIVDRLCENFGKKIDGGYAFPSAETVSKLTLDELAVLRSGFRAKYILDAAKKIAGGEIDLEKIKALPTDDARNELMKIYGVGAKVADCAMLYGMGRLDAFPKDVWIKRALEVLFNGYLPEQADKYAGIIQQYIFFYARTTKLDI